MQFFVNEIVNGFYSLLWPMIRISAMLISAPVLSLDQLSVRVRVLLALALTLIIYPIIDFEAIDPMSSKGLYELFNQIIIGVMMGGILQLVMGAVIMAGQAISNSMGLAMATMVDPGLGNVPVVGQLLVVCATLVFLGLNGHLIIIGMVIKSFETLPIGSSIINVESFLILVQWSSTVFLGGLLIALPLMVGMLLVNIGVGIMARASPNLNIFAVGFPLFFITGFGLLLASFPAIANRMYLLWMEGLARVSEIGQVPGFL